MICAVYKYCNITSGNSIQEGELKTYSKISKTFPFHSTLDLKFRKFGRMKSAPVSHELTSKWRLAAAQQLNNSRGYTVIYGLWRYLPLRRVSFSSSHYSRIGLVSFAAVIRVVTQCCSPLTAAHSSSAFFSLN